MANDYLSRNKWLCIDSKWDFKVPLILWEIDNCASTVQFICESAEAKTKELKNEGGSAREETTIHLFVQCQFFVAFSLISM